MYFAANKRPDIVYAVQINRQNSLTSRSHAQAIKRILRLFAKTKEKG